MTKSTIVFRGDYGKEPIAYSKTSLEQVTDVTALGTLATALGTHTDCNIAKYSFYETVAGTDANPGASANVDRKAVVYMRDPTNLHLVKLSIPAPVAADTELTGAGERLTSVALTAIVGAINTATGRSLTGLYGKVIQGD